MISRHQPCRRTGLVLLSIGLLHVSCLASPDATNEFRLHTRPMAIPERAPVTSYVLQTSNARFSFLPPRNWSVKENPATKEVVMMARNLITSIRFKIVDTGPEATMEARMTQWRQSVLERHTDGKIIEEFRCYTSKVEGAALDLERIGPNDKKISTRLACIPIPAGRVEFDLTTTGGNVADARQAFGNLLTSFRIESPVTK
jgi:hypothetical protein